MSLLGLYRPGTTWLHRLTPGAKLAGLLLASAGVMAVHGPLSALAAAGLALSLLLWSGGGWRATWTALRGLLVVLALLAAWHTWQNDWRTALEVCGDLLALVLLATTLTLTTAVDEMLDTITWALGPLRRLGVNPEAVALAFSLMIRAIPSTIEIADQTRDAARARGLERDPRARLTPLVIRVVARARATGDALHARGIGD